MDIKPGGPRLAGIRLHPIKSLEGVSVRESRIGVGGGLEFDRAWALYSADGQCLNGKRSAALALIRTEFASDIGSVRLSAPDNPAGVPAREFAFPSDTEPAAEWLSACLGQPVAVRYAPEGFPDDTERNGPMVISTATLQTVAGWFPGIDLEESRRRFRTPLEVGGVEAFWEDRLYNEREDVGVRFIIGDVALEGVNPCPRCAVPARDSLSGASMTGFQKTFLERRRELLPSWAPAPERIQHFYHLGVNTRVAASEHGKVLRVDDAVTL